MFFFHVVRNEKVHIIIIYNLKQCTMSCTIYTDSVYIAVMFTYTALCYLKFHYIIQIAGRIKKIFSIYSLPVSSKVS